MKRIVTIAMAFLMMVSSLMAETRTTRATLNFRSGASTKSRVISTIPHGTPVYVHEDLANGWSLVVYNGQIGYAKTSFLNPISEITVANHKTVAVATSSVRHYTNNNGYRVQSPTHYSSVPSGATAICRDGTYSFSRSRRGTCSHHGGVARWL